jgi:hypothetical protein
MRRVGFVIVVLWVGALVGGCQTGSLGLGDGASGGVGIEGTINGFSQSVGNRDWESAEGYLVPQDFWGWGVGVFEVMEWDSLEMEPFEIVTAGSQAVAGVMWKMTIENGGQLSLWSMPVRVGLKRAGDLWLIESLNEWPDMVCPWDKPFQCEPA